MKRPTCVLIAALLFAVVSASAQVSLRYDRKLPADKQITHMLNRMTFGARPGDATEVRRLGVEKWLDLQLHPERIAENPVLESHVLPLESLHLAPWQIAEKYQMPGRPAVRLATVTPASLLTPQQLTTMNNGTPDQRRAVLDSLSPDIRRQLLATAPQRVLESLPDLQPEIQRARQAQQEALQAEARRLNPPINQLVTPEQMRTIRTGTDEQKVALLNSFDAEKRQQVIRAAGPQAFNNIPQLRRQAMSLTQGPQFVNMELIENKLFRSIYSSRQLEEVLVDFWMNHFNVFNGKGQARVLLTSYERDAIRPYVFGRFKDMLLATARHPAMLIYLDNAQSQAPREDLPQFVDTAVRRPGLNENYGRELMELHTLGVDGGYTQEDVIAVARAFTGWTVYDPAKYAEFQFNPAMHDRKEKIVLGHKLPAGRAEQDGLEVIDILAEHPSTAKFISRKLAQRFVSDDPPQALVDRMAATFTKTKGDLRAVVQTLFTSVEFSSEAAWQSKLKSPLEMVISAVRALDAETTDVFALAQRIAEMGQPLYGKQEPTGYPNTGESWASTAGLLSRINFSTVLVAGQVPGVKPSLVRFESKPPAVVASELLGTPAPPALLKALETDAEGKAANANVLVTVLLGSPEFQRR